jgi:hypothetical protein
MIHAHLGSKIVAITYGHCIIIMEMSGQTSTSVILHNALIKKFYVLEIMMLTISVKTF